MLGLDRLFLLDDGDNVALEHPVMFLNPLCQLLVVDVTEEFREVYFVDSLEGGPNDMAYKLTN